KILGCLNTKPRSGRPRKISAQTTRRIVRDVKQNPQVSSGEIPAALEKDGVVVARSTIRRYLNKKMSCKVELPERSLYCVNATKKPGL
ncbi:hypothetical protein FQN60_008443, partial [Etheostoma spectabile]